MSNILSRIKGAASGGASKRLLIVGGAVVVAGLSFVFFSPTDLAVGKAQVDNLNPGGPDTVQGLKEVSPEYKEALTQDDGKRIAEADATGSSAMPTVTIDKTVGLDLEPLVVKAPELEIPEKPAVPLIEKPTVLPPTVPVVPRAVAMETPVDDGRFETVRGRMEMLAPPVYSAAKVDRFGVEEAAAAASTGAGAPSPLGVATASNIDLPAPGTILYARMMTEANSDAPGPILVEIAQGPLRGAKLLGTFSATRNKLVLQFSSLTMERSSFGETRSETVAVDAVAVDAHTVGAGVASSVDYHIVENVGIGFAAAFAQGFGQAIAQSGQSIVSTDSALTIANPALSTEKQLYVAAGTAAGVAGQSLTSLFGNRAPTVKVAAGTPVGVFFLSRGQ